MQYDFTSVIDRRGKDALAVDLLAMPGSIPPGKTDPGFDRIPMWVADMNFPTVPAVQWAITERTAHPMFGYFVPRPEYYRSIIRWQQDRNGVTGLEKQHIGYENGVLGGVVSALRVLCSPGDNVLVHSPTYVGFTATLENNGFHIVHSPLVRDEEGIWRMDYEDMEEKIRRNHIHAAIFCSPHNPTGRVWEREELEQAMDIYRRNDVWVISDEIWSDLILEGKHIPLQSVNEDARNRTAAFYAPSKTFNLAGLVGSYHIIYNRWLRDRIRKESSLSHYNNMNVLSMYGLIGAYSQEGREWLEQLLPVLRGNRDLALRDLAEVPGVQVMKPQGTYMLFLDCEEWCRSRGISIRELQSRGVKYGVIWQDGTRFGGDYTIRMNLASPAGRVEEAFRRLRKYVFV
ncbi:cystathione beta-lyase [Eubacterium pyruvativorans]|uniref:cysteine-S-conjugate beta-lyase n=2 Tax=Eubacterium pyruvativorans TaxID=155865 RepID=A0A1I7FA64_9FIRM|nr:aminotransferase class I/II-fold pyridoxal phosphate-dependent enzyme [Eubacterium pyruvativorans]SFN87274.1 cystathione beta-lyase [Eubacterium pyruvativorans]SFU33077.1 cystathione beta-lyase [Eubacterium pyruvativorans]